MRKTILIFLLVISFASVTACDKSEDVSDMSSAWGSYIPGAKYKTMRDLFLIKVTTPEAGYALVPEGNYKGNVRELYPRPESVKDYLKTKKIVYNKYIAYNFPIEVIAIIKRGAVIETEKAKYFERFSWFFGTAKYYRIYGRLNLPEYHNLLVDLEDVSDRGFGSASSCCRNHKPLQRVLELLNSKKAS